MRPNCLTHFKSLGFFTTAKIISIPSTSSWSDILISKGLTRQKNKLKTKHKGFILS